MKVIKPGLPVKVGDPIYSLNAVCKSLHGAEPKGCDAEVQLEKQDLFRIDMPNMPNAVAFAWRCPNCHKMNLIPVASLPKNLTALPDYKGYLISLRTALLKEVENEFGEKTLDQIKSDLNIE